MPEAEDVEKWDSKEQEYTPDMFDQYINMEVGLPRGSGDQLFHARVKQRAVDEDGKPIGVESNNPLTDTRHKTEAPSSVTYSSVVSRDSVRICLLIAAINNLDLQACGHRKCISDSTM